MCAVTTTVLVPDEQGLAALGALDGVRAVRYAAGADLPPEAADAEVLVPDFLTADQAGLVAALPRLKLVQLLTTGADAWIGRLPDHVMLSTCRGAHGGSSAEWVVGALLTVYRDLVGFVDAQRAGRWTTHVTETLQDKRVLVIGAGDLGRQLERRLLAFDASVTLVATSARPGVRALAELPGLLPEHDAVVLVVPHTPATTGMVDAGFLARMPDGAVLVNVARGPVVDTGALLAELTSGRLRAALDVTDPEPLPEGHPLWSAPGLLLTPHVAGSCTGHRERAYRVVAEQVARFVAGDKPQNLVRGDY
ncbi:2-hydroxyacid dehydrogenase [Actinokineospora sp. PR83]|uniref:2-hydroxyacid dehydrogenase n=1 Tax=Actinokineospora sp. PR83 TaxID=2884908 RepID=UPI0027E0EDA9|nr:2-hydroxyacid dehydrogenase [Actinokineospora sp. PR83]MCG8919474.1 2-hydroxyacid dehydrogenase [Actinokineospora sp. PR83]